MAIMLMILLDDNDTQNAISIDNVIDYLNISELNTSHLLSGIRILLASLCAESPRFIPCSFVGMKLLRGSFHASIAGLELSVPLVKPPMASVDRKWHLSWSRMCRRSRSRRRRCSATSKGRTLMMGISLKASNPKLKMKKRMTVTLTMTSTVTTSFGPRLGKKHFCSIF